MTKFVREHQKRSLIRRRNHRRKGEGEPPVTKAPLPDNFLIIFSLMIFALPFVGR
jgi:hypothetical protein